VVGFLYLQKKGLGVIVESLPVEVLVLDPRNARKHDEKNLSAIAGSLDRFGQRKPIVVTSENVVVAGNGTLTAAVSLGWENIDVVRVPDDWSDDQVKAFALADNRTAELAVWDEQVMASQLLELDAAGFDIAEFGFEAIESKEFPKHEVEPAAFEGVNEVSKLGNIWKIGPHKIMCADSTDVSSIERLIDGQKIDAVITDPPYGINVVQNNQIGGGGAAKPGVYKPVIGDESPDIAAVSFNLIYPMFEKATHVWWGANHYTGKAHLPDASCWIVWDKENGDTTFADAELAWTNSKGSVRIFKHQWRGMIRASERGKRVHPTQKPTALTRWIIETLKVPEDGVVLDLFCGSGSTLVGAAEAGRIGYGIELDPYYVDVIVKRLEEVTGLKAELVS
jgi:16S rRNA G966 N2-methylase RsmD